MERLYGLDFEMILHVMLYVVGGLIGLTVGCTAFGVQYLPSYMLGIVNKLCLNVGPGAEGRLMVLDKESSYRATVLRGGFCLLYWAWQYRLHRGLLKVIQMGTFGCLFARETGKRCRGIISGRVTSAGNCRDVRSLLACSKCSQCRPCGLQPSYCGRGSTALTVRSHNCVGIPRIVRRAARNRWYLNICSPPA